MRFAGRGIFPIEALPHRCAAIAGMLAERSITSLSLNGPGSTSRVLEARATDLPGEIESHAPCVLIGSVPVRLEIRVGRGSIDWATDDEAVAEDLRDLLV